jgi:2-dehydro-3-deoxyphosphogluconate aldolase/(4S)-4-hydroxy-2-oxoglutarate aldolase
LRQLLESVPVIPVITLDSVEDAVPLAEALVAGGLKILEVTLRTEAAIDGIREIIRQVPEAVVGTGTVCTPEQIVLSEQAGCQFMISPGTTPRLLEAARNSTVPLLPGISTVSEMMQCMEYGYRDFKFFPAEAAGGAKKIKSISGPFPDIKFCPTGGIGLNNVMEYLSLSNILCVGGSWLAPNKLIAEKRWDEIQQLAKEASLLRA